VSKLAGSQDTETSTSLYFVFVNHLIVVIVMNYPRAYRKELDVRKVDRSHPLTVCVWSSACIRHLLQEPEVPFPFIHPPTPGLPH
jgi:hypothetical protein